MFRNTAPKHDSKHTCHVTTAIRSVGACHKCFEMWHTCRFCFWLTGSEQITQLHICLNLTFNRFFQKLKKFYLKRSRLSLSTAEQFIFFHKNFNRFFVDAVSEQYLKITTKCLLVEASRSLHTFASTASVFCEASLCPPLLIAGWARNTRWG